LRYQITEKTRFDFKPIIRFNEDISNYQNSSIDISIHHKLDKGWSIQFLSRTWFIADTTNSQFLWWDIAHQIKTKSVSITNRVRMHLSLNLNNVNPADFLRFQTTLAPNVKWKIKPFINFEPWWQLDNENAFRRIRYEPGLRYSFGDHVSLTTVYRRQDSIGIEPPNKQNHYVLTLLYKI